MCKNDIKKRINKKYVYLLGIVILLVLITTAIISGSLSRYVASFSGSDTARVAKFGISVNQSTESTQTVNLFDTIYDTVDDTQESDVWSSNGDKVIAPGTWGNFEVQLTNNSEVGVEYSTTMTITNIQNIPVNFFMVSDGVETPISLSNGSAILSGLSGTFGRQDASVISRIIKWRWDYSTDRNGNGQTADEDAADTELGTSDVPPSLSVQISVTAHQVD